MVIVSLGHFASLSPLRKVIICHYASSDFMINRRDAKIADPPASPELAMAGRGLVIFCFPLTPVK
jgi:hypothetical protein